MSYELQVDPRRYRVRRLESPLSRNPPKSMGSIRRPPRIVLFVQHTFAPVNLSQHVTKNTGQPESPSRGRDHRLDPFCARPRCARCRGKARSYPFRNELIASVMSTRWVRRLNGKPGSRPSSPLSASLFVPRPTRCSKLSARPVSSPRSRGTGTSSTGSTGKIPRISLKGARRKLLKMDKTRRRSRGVADTHPILVLRRS